ncbi:hypothetical protein BDP27DRAFT_1343503 [Rhodocollybia butyracea]|uniref:Uncharacterized protein n=1 Tax=Rhodocollybia butyracea TaxID=206335 RepID=A0A9P5PAD1_9AGAR|nr:hypothetical protein BDP27DRAFT_1343503 [Rhodocollybia butyracea]
MSSIHSPAPSRHQSLSSHYKQRYSSLKNDSDETRLKDPPGLPSDQIPPAPSRRVGYLTALLSFVSAVIVAVANHIVFSQLDGKPTGDHIRQFWVSTLRTVFPVSVGFLLVVGLNKCLSQVALYCVRTASYPVALVNLLTSPPDILTTISILFRSPMRVSFLGFIILATIIQVMTFTSSFIPGTLTVTPGPSRHTTLEIPTIDFNNVYPMQSSFVTLGNDTPRTVFFLEPSQRWSQLISRAASSGVAPIWDPPVECGSSCTYNFTYSAPALNCTELSREDIWPSGTNTSDSLLAFPLNSTNPPHNEYFFYNASFAIPSSVLDDNTTSSTLSVVYMHGFNSTYNGSLNLFGENPDPSQYNPSGVHCEYQNGTYEATTKFMNNTQISTTRVTQLNGYLPIGHEDGPYFGPYIGTNTTQMTLAFRSIAQTFSEMLNGGAFFMTNISGLGTDGTEALKTPLFNLTGHIGDVLGDNQLTNQYFFALSQLQANLSSSIPDLLGNVTLAFVSEGTGNTTVPAFVTPNTPEYQYHPRKLALIYGIVIGVSLAAIVYGLICLQANGTTANFDLEHIVEMTAESKELHASAVRPGFEKAPVKVNLFRDGGDMKTVLDLSR